MNLYLSRLLLNPRCRQVQSELAYPYEMHRTIMKAFLKSVDGSRTRVREGLGVLFRADVDDSGKRVTVYVQSTVMPDWSFIEGINDYLIAEAEPANPVCKKITKAFQNLKNGQIFTFRLRANPTKRIGRASKGYSELKGKRVGLLREEEQIAWLVRKGHDREKGKPGGFEILMHKIEDREGEIRSIPRVNVRREGKQRGRKKEEEKAMIHLAVRFDGLLRVTDADAFRETLSRGIGSGKAFGFGLLSLAPAGYFGN